MMTDTSGGLLAGALTMSHLSASATKFRFALYRAPAVALF